MNHRYAHWPTVLFLVMVAGLAAHCIYDPDFWYHLAIGEHIVRTGQIPRTNLFSFAWPDHPWADVYWLYDLALAILWKTGGSLLIVGFKILLNLALAALVIFALRDRHQPLTGLEIVALLLAWLTIAPRLSDRPELVTYVCLAGVLALIRCGRLWWCIPLQIVWANVHTLFYLGPALLLLHAGRQRRALPVAVAAAVASCVSPFGWNNLLVAGELWQTMRVLGHQVEELASPFHPAVWASSGSSILFLVWIIGGGLLVLRSPRSLTLFDGAISLATVLLAARSQRAIPVAVLGSLPAVLNCARAAPARTDPLLRWAAVALMVGVTVDFVAGTNRLARFPRGDRVFGAGVLPNRFPDQAVVQLNGLLPASARLANVHFHTGGFVLWATGGERRVFIDARLEAYPREFVADYSASVHSAAAFGQFADRFGVTHAFVVKDQPEARQLARQLAQAEGWRRLYTDQQAEIFLRAL